MIHFILRTLSFLKRKVWWLTNVGKFKQLGKKSYFKRGIMISKGNIICGQRVYVWNNCRIEAITSYSGQLFTPVIILSDFVTIQQNLHLTCATKISIGKNTALAANVTITDIHHQYENIEIPIEYQKIETKAVDIGADCKIYNNVVILPGTTIGKHCSVGANSVVSGSYPDFCVIAGAPAKIVKHYDPQSQTWIKTHNK